MDAKLELSVLQNRKD